MVSLTELAVVFVLFTEAGFPTAGIDGGGAPFPFAPAGAQLVSAESADALAEALTPGRVLVWRHGGAFPAEAWPAIEAFLADGGSLLHLGGPIFENPVAGPPGARELGPRRISVPRHLGLKPGGVLPVGGASLRTVVGRVGEEDPPERGEEVALLPPGAKVHLLEPRFSSRKIRPDEEGSPGVREAVLRPIHHIHRPSDEPRFPAAAGAVAIDRLRERYAGGRWVLRLLEHPPTEAELGALLPIAAERPLELTLDAVPGSIHENEVPSFRVQLFRPGGSGDPPAVPVRLSVRRPGEAWAVASTLEFPPTRDAVRTFSLPASAPGLIFARVEAEGIGWGGRATGGVWVFDPELFASGDSIRAEGELIVAGGEAEVGIGTTVMSRSVHREFLDRPNPAEWDDTFRELSALGVRWIRTGIWSGWADIMPELREDREEWLRALEAFYLTARRHDIGVIFTFFAFVPPPLEGSSPYFQRQDLARQSVWLRRVAARFAPAKGIIWDLINEPSFSDPERLWLCRPTRTREEREQFLRYLAETFEPEGPRTWEDVVRERWRLRPDERIGLPEDGDFDDRIVFEDHRPLRARDYIRFASIHFGRWAEFLRRALREGGSDALVTVGQDEGGVNDRPSPHFHRDAVDFVSMHTWWYDDAQLWDIAMARVPGKPCWVTETLLMRREELSGEIFRTPEQRRAIFARKLALPFAGGATQVLSWAYDVNPYMDSDNEVSIGLRRVDGSYTGEHAVFRSFARAFASRRGSFAPPARADVSILLPTHDHRSPRDIIREGSQRLVNILVSLGHRVRIVHEELAREDLGGEQIVILPSCRGLLQDAWDAHRERKAGSSPPRVISSGWFERDEVAHPAARLGLPPRPLAPTEWAGELPLSFPLAATQSVHAASMGEGVAAGPLGWSEREAGHWHHPLPIDLARDDGGVRALYRAVVGAPEPCDPGLFVVPIPRNRGHGWVVVNQSGRPTEVGRDPDGPGPLPPVRITIEAEGAGVVWREPDGALESCGQGVRIAQP